MDFLTTLLLLACTAAAVHLFLRRASLTREVALEIILMWMLAIGLGINGIYAFIGHTFFADQVAAAIGWPAGNPFQLEVGLANLGFGICGLLCLKFRDGTGWRRSSRAGSSWSGRVSVIATSRSCTRTSLP